MNIDKKLIKIVSELLEIAKKESVSPMDAAIAKCLSDLIGILSDEIIRLNKEIKSLQDKISLLDHSL